MSFLRQDLSYTLRSLRKTPGFTLVAVLTLALGIGANTAIFSVVDAVILAPLPYNHPEQLVLVWQTNPQGRNISPSYPDFQDWQHNTHSFQDMAAIGWQSRDLTGPGSPEHLNGWLIGSGFFRTMGANPIVGRDFTPEEDQRGGAFVAIISERVWKDRFSGGKAVLGKTVTMDGDDYTIVGVAPSGINLGGVIDVYTPISQGDALVVNDRRAHAFVAIGRLKPGTSVTEANADTNTVEKNLGDLYPKFDQGLSTRIVPLKEALVGDVSATLMMLLGSVGLVLLIACANVASLMLARAASREREFAIRAALGAKRIRIVWQMVAESLLLSLAGGTLGLLLARVAVRPLFMAVPGEFPRPEHIGLNSAVLLFTLGTSVIVGIVFGLIPALKTWNANQQPSLQQGGRGSTSLHHRTQSSLVVVQTAMALVLLVGAGLLFRTIRHLSGISPGFETHQLISFKAALAPEVTKHPQAMRVADQQLIQRIQGIDGVEAADLTTLVPLSGEDNEVPFWLGEEPRSIAEAPRAVTYSVGPDYLRVMGIPLLRGRFFTAADTVQSEQVIVIDNALAEAYFPGKDPVGQHLTFGRVGAFRIIGVAGHVKHWGLGDTSASNQKEVYTPFYQLSDQWLPVLQTSATVMVRTRLDASALMPAIRSAVYGAGSGQPIYDVHTMQQMISASMATQNFPMMLLAAFAALALLLASVGIYAVISYSVTGRVHEIGIRMALGAEKRRIFAMVIQQGLRLVISGLAIGMFAAFLIGRLLVSFSHLLYGVNADDPLTFVGVAFLLSVLAVLACYIPARRATRVDPMIALRAE
ncbi:MAG TPA: ABC transporter permease [Candidatus Angelobacter sp.]|nr:ABC transporter permease [Candidatus Angelobacter sp.]